MSNSPRFSGNYLIDINIACYNHEKFIAQAIESVLNQKTNFPFRIIIGDDCSTDNSASIIKSYEFQYPDVIQAYYHPVNLGFESVETNGLFLLNQSTSKYIAFLDGDDYWTDENKLQKQVDLLENNADFVFCSHAVVYKHDDKLKKDEINGFQKDEIQTADCLFGTPSHPNSWVFKNGLGLPPDFNSIRSTADDAFMLFFSTKGRCAYIDTPMSVYRISDAGSWSTLSNFEKDIRIYVFDMWVYKHFKEYRYVQRKHLLKLTKKILFPLILNFLGVSSNAKMNKKMKILIRKNTSISFIVFVVASPILNFLSLLKNKIKSTVKKLKFMLILQF